MAEHEGLAPDLFIGLDFGKLGYVMGSALRGPSVGMAAFWIRHYFFSRCTVYLRSRGLYFFSSRRS